MNNKVPGESGGIWQQQDPGKSSREHKLTTTEREKPAKGMARMEKKVHEISGVNIVFEENDRVYHGSRGAGTIIAITEEELYVAFDIGETRRYFWRSVFKLTILKRKVCSVSQSFADPRVEAEYRRHRAGELLVRTQMVHAILSVVLGCQVMIGAFIVQQSPHMFQEHGTNADHWELPAANVILPHIVAIVIIIFGWCGISYLLDTMGKDMAQGMNAVKQEQTEQEEELQTLYWLDMSCNLIAFAASFSYIVPDWIAYMSKPDRAQFAPSSMVPIGIGFTMLFMCQVIPFRYVFFVACVDVICFTTGYVVMGMQSSWVTGFIAVILVWGCVFACSLLILEWPSRNNFLTNHLSGNQDYGSILEVPSNPAAIDAHIKGQERIRRWMIPGENLEREKFIGQGSFGDVYLGHYLGMPVAIKTSKCLSTDAYQELVREFLFHIEIRHPCICQLLGISVQFTNAAKVEAAFVLEFMERGNLDSIVYNRAVPMTLDFICKALCNISQGITHLHQNQPQIIHADLKSENVFMDRYGDCKIGDLGGSVMLDRVNTHHRAPLSLIYASPKRLSTLDAAEKCHLSLKDDIYSFGMIVFELLVREEAWVQYADDSVLISTLVNGQGDLQDCIPTKSASDVSWLTKEMCDLLMASEQKGTPTKVLMDFVQNVLLRLTTLMMNCVDFDEAARPTSSQVTDEMTTILKMIKTPPIVMSSDDDDDFVTGAGALAAAAGARRTTRYVEDNELVLPETPSISFS